MSAAASFTNSFRSLLAAQIQLVVKSAGGYRLVPYSPESRPPANSVIDNSSLSGLSASSFFFSTTRFQPSLFPGAR